VCCARGDQHCSDPIAVSQRDGGATWPNSAGDCAGDDGGWGKNGGGDGDDSAAERTWIQTGEGGCGGGGEVETICIHPY